MQSGTVLVVEDNELNMKLVRSLLQLEGYRVLEAADAETGLLLSREQVPDLVLMDIQLPGMDGLEATRLMLEDETQTDIPVVALTSYAMVGDKEAALAAGCVGYITKPIDTRTFIETIQRFIPETGSRLPHLKQVPNPGPGESRRTPPGKPSVMDPVRDDFPGHHFARGSTRLA